MAYAVQDLPPPGGFGKINVDRVPARPVIKQGIWAAILIGAQLYGWKLGHEMVMKTAVLNSERVEAYIALQPFLIAERERKFLRQLRLNREYERELMKNHKNWEVGTLYGEKLFKTLPEGALPPIDPQEYAAHYPYSWWVDQLIPDRYL